MTIITRSPLFRASAPFATLFEHLGPLAELPGTWVGNGFNLISLPDHQHRNSFQVKLNATQETVTFTPIGAPIPDRGFFQGDIFFEGLHYVQQVSDAVTGEALHIETGMWLHVPETTDPSHHASVVRLSTIPHGDSLLAQGHAASVDGPTDFGSESVMPFTLPPNQPPNVLGAPYTDPITKAPLPPNIPFGANTNPNDVLSNVLTQEQRAGVTMVKATIIRVAANPVGGIQGFQPKDVGGIVNIPFIQKNAKVQNFAATFFIETMENATTGQQFLQLQYSQTVLLQFEINPGDNLVIHWPHVSVGTLVKQ